MNFTYPPSMKPTGIQCIPGLHLRTANPVVAISRQGLGLPELNKIQQIDVSMHLPHYIGLNMPLFGCVVSVLDNESANLRHIPMLFLFQARHRKEFPGVVALLRSIKWPVTGLRPWLVSRPYPVRVPSKRGNLVSTLRERGKRKHARGPSKSFRVGLHTL